MKNYLEAYHIDVGLLVNFGSKSLIQEAYKEKKIGLIFLL